MRTKVVHYKRAKYDIYIGRPSKWGNPFSSGTREQNIKRYAEWILTQPDLMKALPELKGKVLGCWCKPEACHGDVLAKLADGVGNVGSWFGKGCAFQACQFEGWDTEHEREEDRSSPVLVFCNHGGNPNDTEGNCCEKLCPLTIKPTIKQIVQVSFAGNLSYLYDFFTDLDLQEGDPVVCDTVRGYSVGKAVGFVETSTKATNWIVQKVDVEGHRARMKERRAAKELEELLG
ncbi:MAG: DUF4326 domain-containing protein [Bacillota bacterium]